MSTGPAPARPLSSQPKGPRHGFRPALEALEGRVVPSSTISISGSSVNVDGSGAVVLDFTVSRSGDLGPAVTVAYNTSDGSAKAGTDYTASSGQVTIAAGSATATIAVPVTDQFIYQTSRSFSVNLTSVVSVLTPASFAPPASFAVGAGPFSVAVGDLNGDGKPDLAVANFDSGTVSVLLDTTAPGSTTPSFAPQQTFAVGSAPVSVAIGDFNGDGKPDLAVANDGSNTVSVLLNATASGSTAATFASQATFAVGSGPYSVAIGDFNGDGRPDLAVANEGSGTVSVLLNKTVPGSTPTFAPQQTFAVGSAPESMTVGDLNGDGRPDIITANRTSSGSVSVLLNTTASGSTAPSFATHADFAVGSYPQSVAIGDLNGDGRPDLAVANGNTSSVTVLLNTTASGSASPSFAPPSSFAVGLVPVSVAIGDLNGDGKPDLAVGTFGAYTVTVLLNTTASGSASPSFANQASFNVGGETRSVAIGDFNGDGKPDLAVAASASSDFASVLLNTAMTGASPATLTADREFAVGSQPTSVAVGDLNGDGRPDLAVADRYSNAVSVLLNATAPGATTPTFSPAINFAVGLPAQSLAIGDLNGDGKPDIAIATLGANIVSVLLNTTAPGATTPTFATHADFAVGSNPFSVAIGDLNGDGLPDLVTANDGPNSVSVLLSTTTPGATTPSFAPAANFAVGTNPVSVAIGDFNGDGRPDLAVANLSSAAVSVLLNTTALGATTASFAAQATFAVGAGPDFVAVGDLNGDGRPDIAVANSGSNTVSVLLNATAPGSATPSFAAATGFAVGSKPYSVAIGDLNGDGRPDLAVANSGSNTVSVLLNATAPGSATPSFAAQSTFAVGSKPYSVAVGDLNGDGRPDLAVADRYSNAVSVLLNATISATIAQGTATGTINFDDTPASITPTAGNNQSAEINTAFATNLAATVYDAANHPIQDVPVTFAAPTSGATGTFPGNVASSVANSNVSGLATAATLTADGIQGRYSVTASAPGVAPSASFTLTNLTLAVASFTSTSTGFTATFTEPFVLAPLNLYDTATAGFGPADVTLVGASTGPVTGSLVVTPGNQAITFVKTGGVLAPDSYTVTLRSASNGFEDASGNLLDGNADGTPGDNYVTTFAVAPTSARVLAVPDFARGPGQGVVIPAATGSGLPLTISDGSGVTSISLSLTYNPALLTITGANPGSSAPAGSSVTINTSTPGLAVVTFTSPTALPAGLDNFATLVAGVPNAAPYASKEDLVISNIALNGGAIPATDQDGVHVVAYLGDTTGNGGYSSFDATLVRQVVANISTGFAAYPLLDPRIVGDIAGFGTLSGIDATYITQYVANLPQPRIPALPGVTIVAGGPDPLIWLPQDVTASPGSSLTVPVMFRQTNGTAIGLDSADIAIEFDPSIFVVTGVSLGGVTQGFTLTESYDNATGAIIASLRSSTGAIELTPGTEGTLLLVDLAIRPGASLGAARLNLLGEGRVGSSVLYTSLNDGNLTLTPAPSDSDLDPVDGVVTVTAPTTAQPVPIATTASAPSPALVLAPTVEAAGPPDAVDRAIQASHGVGIPASPSPGDSSPGELIPWTPADPSTDPGEPVIVPTAKRAGAGRVLLGLATPDGLGSHR